MVSLLDFGVGINVGIDVGWSVGIIVGAGLDLIRRSADRMWDFIVDLSHLQATWHVKSLNAMPW